MEKNIDNSLRNAYTKPMYTRSIAMTVCMLLLATVNVPAKRLHSHQAFPNTAAIEQKTSELAQIRGQINTYQKQLDRLTKTEHSPAQALEAYTTQTHLLKNLITELNGEDARLTDDIAETRQEISSSEQTLQQLKTQYARAVVALYKTGIESDAELLLGSHPMNDAIARGEYLRRFSLYRQRLALNITLTVAD